jgi:hypothetical protein
MGVCGVHWKNSIKEFIYLVILSSLFLILLSMPVYAAMNEMTEDALSEITGEGFSSFTLIDGIARASFNITASTFTEIQSLKMGYYNDGTALGWDEDWQGVSLGSATTDLTSNGLYIEAKFSNISDPVTRTLDYIKVGTPDMTGPISANFVSFSGHIENPTDGVLYDGHRITTIGQATITSTNSEFYLKLENAGIQKGWWVFWNKATVGP